MIRPTARTLPWAVVATASGLVVAAELRRPAIDPALPSLTAATASGVVFAVLGALILDHRPRHGLGRLYLGIGLLLSLFSLTNVRATAAAAIWFNSWAWLAGPVLLLTFGTFLLPDGRRPSGCGSPSCRGSPGTTSWRV